MLSLRSLRKWATTVNMNKTAFALLLSLTALYGCGGECDEELYIELQKPFDYCMYVCETWPQVCFESANDCLDEWQMNPQTANVRRVIRECKQECNSQFWDELEVNGCVEAGYR